MSNFPLTALPYEFRDVITQLTSLTPLTGENGQKYLTARGLLLDLLQDKMTQAVTIRIPGQGDISQLPYLAQDRQLEQGPAESNASFIARLQTAFPDAKIWGSRYSVLRELQAYLQNLYPGVPAGTIQMAIVGGNGTHTTWDYLNQGASLGSPPIHQLTTPINWNWDGNDDAKPWRSWLIFYMYQTGNLLSGAAGQITAAASGSIPGGQNVSGVWVPPSSGAPVNTPWVTVSGLSGLSTNNLGQWLTLVGGANNNQGTFPIVSVINSTTCVVANPAGTSPDAGPFAWGVAEFPFVGPAMPYGAANAPAYGSGTYGVDVTPATVQSLRQIVQKRKSAGAYYPYIVFNFDDALTLAPLLTAGGGENPDGTYGPTGQNVAGVWVPTRIAASPPSNLSYYTAWCQGTGSYNLCSVENVT